MKKNIKMKRKTIVILVVAATVISAIGLLINKNYKTEKEYTVVINYREFLLGNPDYVITEKRIKVNAANDTIAFDRACFAFYIARKAYIIEVDLDKSKAKSVKYPIEFKLINSENEDITSIEFITRKQVEKLYVDMLINTKNKL